MITFDQTIKLASLKDRASLEAEISKLSEADAKAALVMTILAWQKNIEAHEQIERELRDQIKSPQT